MSHLASSWRTSPFRVGVNLYRDPQKDGGEGEIKQGCSIFFFFISFFTWALWHQLMQDVIKLTCMIADPFDLLTIPSIWTLTLKSTVPQAFVCSCQTMSFCFLMELEGCERPECEVQNWSTSESSVCEERCTGGDIGQTDIFQLISRAWLIRRISNQAAAAALPGWPSRAQQNRDLLDSFYKNLSALFCIKMLTLKHTKKYIFIHVQCFYFCYLLSSSSYLVIFYSLLIKMWFLHWKEPLTEETWLAY